MLPSIPVMQVPIPHLPNAYFDAENGDLVPPVRNLDEENKSLHEENRNLEARNERSEEENRIFDVKPGTLQITDAINFPKFRIGEEAGARNETLCGVKIINRKQKPSNCPGYADLRNVLLQNSQVISVSRNVQ